jgi:hypothetical protein
METDSARRTIRAECLAALMAGRHPVEVVGAHVTDDLVVRFAEVKVPVLLREVTFTGVVHLEKSTFRTDVRLDSSTFEQVVYLRARFEGDLALNGAIFYSGVDGYQAWVGGNLTARGTQFHGRTDLRQLDVQGDARFDAMTATTTDLSRAVFHGDLVFTGSRFRNATDTLNLERASVNQSLFLNRLGTKAPTVRLLYTRIGYNLRADGTRWGSPVDLGGVETGKHLDLTESVFHAPVDLRAAQVGGSLRLRSAVFQDSAKLHRAKVNGTLTLEEARFTRFLSLDGVSANTLNITRVQGFPPQSSFLVDGLTFGHMQYLVNGKPHPDSLLGFLRHADFSANAYVALENVFAQHGERRLANRTLFQRRARERDTLPPWSQAGSLFLLVTMGYGRWPALAFIWWAVIVALGAWVFRNAQPEPVEEEKAEEKEKKAEEKASSKTFSSVLYSLDTFLPAVDLKYADEWSLKRDNHPRAWLYLRLHTIAGWILVPIALAAISGLLK